MKKLLSLALAAIMVLSLTTVAFAADSGSTDVSSVTVTKTVTATGLEDETFDFTVTCTSVTDAAENVDTGTYTIDAFSIKVKANETTGTATITLPEYKSVGVYTYCISETTGSTAGVAYTTTDMYLVVTVTNNADGGFVRSVAIHEGSANGNKVEADSESDSVTINFENTYGSGSLAVSKTVTGNLGDKSKEFNVTVTFTSTNPVNSIISYTEDGETKTIAVDDWTDGSASVTIALKDSETITFSNIPAGVTYTVVEDDYTESDSYDAAKYEYSDENQTIADKDTDTVKITNNKESTVDTGINLDTLPYMMLLAVVAIAAVALLRKRQIVD